MFNQSKSLQDFQWEIKIIFMVLKDQSVSPIPKSYILNTFKRLNKVDYQKFKGIKRSINIAASPVWRSFSLFTTRRFWILTGNVKS